MVKTLRKAAPLNQNGGMDHPSVWLTLSPAIFGLVGVIIGGLITSGTSYWLETRKDKREQEKESRIRAAALRQAARLIDIEFSLASAFAQFAVQLQRWSDVPLAQPATISWEKYNAVLATELSDAAWGLSVGAYGAVTQLIDLRSKGCDPADRSKPSNTALKAAESLRQQIEKGRVALAPATATPIVAN